MISNSSSSKRRSVLFIRDKTAAMESDRMMILRSIITVLFHLVATSCFNVVMFRFAIFAIFFNCAFALLDFLKKVTSERHRNNISFSLELFLSESVTTKFKVWAKHGTCFHPPKLTAAFMFAALSVTIASILPPSFQSFSTPLRKSQRFSLVWDCGIKDVVRTTF